MPWNALLAIRKSFVRAHLDYGDILKELLEQDSIKNWDLNHWVFVNGLDIFRLVINQKHNLRLNLYKFYLFKITRMILAPIVNLVYTFVEQMPLNTRFSLIPFQCGKSFKEFRHTLLKLEWSTPDLIYGIHHPLGLKLLTRLRLGLSHLNEHRFKHGFKNCINTLCTRTP